MNLEGTSIYGAPAGDLFALLRRLHLSQHGLSPGPDRFGCPMAIEEALMLEKALDRAVAEMRQEAAEGDRFLAVVQGEHEEFRRAALARLMRAADDLDPGVFAEDARRLLPPPPARRLRRPRHRHR